MIDADPSRAERASPLARYLFAAYVLLIGYGSLYPLTGWRDQGLSTIEVLLAPLPRYVTAFDLAANFIAYFPLGFLTVLALHPAVRGTAACAGAALVGTLLSAALEVVQSHLPDRIPSNLDVALNAAGTAAGACAAAYFLHRYLRTGTLHALRDRLFVPGSAADFGLVLVALWQFAALNPETLLFGNGDLRNLLFGELPGVEIPPETFVRIEAVVSAANLVAIGLFVALLVAKGEHKRWIVLSAIAAALVVRTLAFGVLFKPDDAFAWLTPGAVTGIVLGTALALAAVSLSRPVSVALCGVLLMAATVLVNLAPANPYLANSLAVWRQGHFLNFNGLTRLVSALWPFVALGYVLFFGGRRRSG